MVVTHVIGIESTPGPVKGGMHDVKMPPWMNVLIG